MRVLEPWRARSAEIYFGPCVLRRDACSDSGSLNQCAVWQGLNEVLQAFSKGTDELLENKVASDNVYMVYKIQNRILGLPAPLVSFRRTFITEFVAEIVIGWPHVLQKENRTFFLFNTCIIITEMPIANSEGRKYVARMDLGPWSSSTIKMEQNMFTVHMEEVTWAIFLPT